MNEKLVMVDSTAGLLEAEILRALLESHDIQALLSQESAGSAIGLSVGPLGRVDILVDSGQATKAREILKAYRDSLASDDER